MKALTVFWQKEETLSKVIPIAIFLGLMILSARIMIPLVATPVPVTLQVLVVLISGLVLGSRKAAFVQASYLGLVLAGLPITALGISGPAAFIGPTAGYLLMFLPAAFAVGYIKENFRENFRENLASLTMAALAGIVLIYLGGTTWLAVYLHSFTKAWMLGAAPFVAVDLAKAAFAVAITKALNKSW